MSDSELSKELLYAEIRTLDQMLSEAKRKTRLIESIQDRDKSNNTNNRNSPNSHNTTYENNQPKQRNNFINNNHHNQAQQNNYNHSQNGFNKRPQRRCFNCDEVGHFANVCPNTRREQIETHQNNHNQSQPTITPFQPPHNNITHHPNNNPTNTAVFANHLLDNSIKSNLIVNDAKTRRIKGICKLNSLPVEFQVDTGADFTIIGDEIINSLNVTVTAVPEKTNLKMADQTRAKLLGKVEVNLEIGEEPMRVSIFVVQGVGKGILIGLDILSTHPEWKIALERLYEITKKVTVLK